MIKVLYLTTGLHTGGAEVMLYHLLAKLDKSKFTPVVISLLDKGIFGEKIEALGIPVYILEMNHSLPNPRHIKRLIKLVKELQPDVIQGWMYHGNLAAKLASFLSLEKIPVVWNIQHSMSDMTNEKKLTQSVIRFSSLLSPLTKQTVFVSHRGKSQHEALGYDASKSCVIPNGIDTSIFKPSESARIKIRQELGLAEDTFLIGKIARFDPQKDHANFVQAAALLLKKHPQIHFLLVGRNATPENQQLQQWIEQLGITSQIHCLGEREDTPTIAAALDISSLSSAYGEACPLAIEESMSCGVPCVMTDVGDAHWIIADTGKVVPIKNPQALADAWQEIIELEKSDRLKLGTAARNRIMEFFSLESVVAQYEEIYLVS